MKILLIGGIPESLIRFRGPLVERLVGLGHEVLAVAGHEDPATSAELGRLGARVGTYFLQRDGTSIRADLRTCRSLLHLMRHERPDMVIAYTAKPVIWGGIATRLARVPAFHALITGLGAQFDGARSRGWRAAGIEWLYRTALAKAASVVFQNDDDRHRLHRFGALAGRSTWLVDGSGVDTRLYRPSALPKGAPVMLMAARLIGAKGVREYVEAARIVRAERPDVRFQLAGGLWTGPDALLPSELAAWQQQGVIEYLGELPFLLPALDQAHVFVLPSYYGEGLPRTLLEAMAVGRPVITTDSVGCREPVIDGTTGLLVAPRSVPALVEGLRRMLEARNGWPEMGSAAQILVDERYEVNRVNDEMIRIFGLAPPVTPFGQAPPAAP